MAGLTDIKKRKKVFNFALFLVLLLSIPACVGLFSVVDELNIALFKDNSGVEALKILTIQILFFQFIFLSTAVMQQEGQYSRLMMSVLAGILVKIGLTAPLTMEMGISGAAISSVAALGIMAVINLFQFKKMIYRQSILTLIKVLFSTLGLWMTLDYLGPQIPTILSGMDDVRMYNVISLAIQVMAGVTVYGLIMGIFLMTTKVAGKGAKRRKKKAKNVKSIAKV